MVVTRSHTGDNVEEEERLRLLEEERRLLEEQRLHQERQRLEQTPLRGGPAEGGPAEPADPLRAMADNPNLIRRQLLDISPASPPVQDRGEFLRNVGWAARPRDVYGVPPSTNPEPEQRADRGPTQEAQRPAGRERVAFAPRPASVASTAIEVRRRKAELEAAEQIAELRRRELQLQEELINKRLAATIEQIEVEGSRAGGSVADPANRVGDWLENVQSERAAPTQRRTRGDSPSPRRARDEFQTPSRDRSVSRSRAIDRLTDHLETMMRPPPRQVYELPIFAGEPSEWLTFLNSFEQSTSRYKFTPYENVARLRHALKGEARQCVHHMLASSASPELIIRVLKKNFGRTDILIDRAIEELKRMPPIGPSATDLNTFAIKIMNITSTLVSLDKRSYGANPLLIREITERLSPHLRSRWCAYAKERYTPEQSELSLMAEFLLDESDAELEFSHARAPTRRAAPEASQRDGRRAPIPAGGGAFRRPQPQPNYERPNRTYATTTKVSNCLCCGGGHNTPDCRRLRSMQLGARWDWARENRVCFKCMNQKHRRERCSATVCGIGGCPHSHHPVLHEPNPQHGYQAPPAQAPPAQAPVVQAPLAPAPRFAAPLASPRAPPARAQTQRAAACATTEPYFEPERSFAVTNAGPHVVGNAVLLKVVPILLSGPRRAVRTHALLDEGSTVSLVDERLARAIGATGPEAPLCIQGVGQMLTNQRSQRVLTKVRGIEGGPEHDLTLRTVPNLGLRSQRLNRAELSRYGHLAGLNEAAFQDGVPYVLIGADHWHIMVPQEVRTGRINEPAALRTDLGWVVYGTVPRLIKINPTQTSLHLAACEPELNDALKRFFSVDSLGVKLVEKNRPLEERAEQIFNQTVREIHGPRYEVGQLWRDNDPRMPPTYGMAFRRLQNLEKKMDRDPTFAAEYAAQVNNLLEKGYAEPSEVNEPQAKEWYLPHFGVTNPNKPGKLRLVFDAAATVQGRCLNDYLLEGPDMLQSLLGILFRFREGIYAVTADIKEMFLQIKLRREDQPSQMFLWRGSEREGPPKRYKMTSIIFGAASSPFIAHSVRNHNADLNKVRYPLAVKEIRENHYMDDYVASYSSEAEVVTRAEQVAASHTRAGFQLRNYSTNSEELRKRLPSELLAESPTQLGGKQKILGMMWFPNRDELGFNTTMMRVPAEVRTCARGPTKREMLSAVMSVYDPIGLLSQYTITAKIQLQRLWQIKLGWDEEPPPEEGREFQQWLRALESVAALRVPRCYATGGLTHRELHVFVDASAQAYAAIAYWRAVNEPEKKVCIVAAKAKVAPTKALSIPRLELQAALIGARLAQSIRAAHRVEVSRVVLWSDSRTVLQWVRNDTRRYSAFVAHRLGEISELTSPEQWRWVPTKDNPADDATRADSARQVKVGDRWYTGPPFLQRPEEEWPQDPEPSPKDDHEEEEVRTCLATRSEGAPLPSVARFSNYDRLVGATARVLQFLEMVKHRRRVPLELRHIKGAEHLWYQHVQREDFPEELRSLARGEKISKKSRLYSLDPRLDEDGVMRMRGRIDAAPVRTYDKRPVILDGRNPWVKLLILRAHQRAAHANNERVVNDLRQQYWILHLRPTVRAVANACQLCILRRARPQVPALGDLPLARIEPFHRPFTNAAVDYFGPLVVTVGRRHEKRWVALFTCLTTRAVHLELAHSLSTGSAIMALRRMAARRGWPRVMYSDNGTNFRGADAELRAAYKEWLPAMRQHGARYEMEWRFIPPGAPNQGGAWERLVRSVKTALTATLASKAPKEEVLWTLLAEAEHTVNARPLTHVSVEAADEEALTPNHFLLGGSTGAPLTGPCEEADRRTWRASQALADHFWARWVREYLPTLAPRRSSAAGERQLHVGDYVVVVDPTLPRNVWPRGVVEATYPGPDGGVRSADVRTRGGVFRRPTTKLAVVPLQPGSTRRVDGGIMLTTATSPRTTKNVN